MERKEDEKEYSKDNKLLSDEKLISREEAPAAKSIAISGGYEQIYVILKNDNSNEVKVIFQ